MYRAFVKEIFQERLSIRLSPEESKHLLKVLRQRKGDQLCLINGNGEQATAVIREDDLKGALVEIESIQSVAAAYPPLYLLIAAPKHPDRMEWLVEKATENGIHTIQPIISARSEKSKISLERLERIAISAIKQSGNLHLPKIKAPVSFSEALQNCDPESQKFIAWVPTEQTHYIFRKWKPGKATTVLIGPEGDFTETEAEQAIGMGFEAVSLGSLTLRTETAGVYVSIGNSVVNLGG